jgi:hypothetical protein
VYTSVGYCRKAIFSSFAALEELFVVPMQVQKTLQNTTKEGLGKSVKIINLLPEGHQHLIFNIHISYKKVKYNPRQLKSTDFAL